MEPAKRPGLLEVDFMSDEVCACGEGASLVSLFSFAARLIIVCGVLLGSRVAAEPAALVLGTSGPIEPHVAPFSEVESELTLTLSPGARMTIVHYRSCFEVEVEGGRIEIGADDYWIEGGRVVREVRIGCPVELSTGNAGEDEIFRGLILRRAEDGSSLRIALTGPDAEIVDRITVVGDEAVLGQWRPEPGARLFELPDVDRVGRLSMVVNNAKGDVILRHAIDPLFRGYLIVRIP